MTEPRTSKERRELIHELLTEEVREQTDDPGDTTVVTSWVAHIGVQTMNVSDQDDYGWVARVTSDPRPPAFVLEGLVEQFRRVDLASLISYVGKDDDQ